MVGSDAKHRKGSSANRCRIRENATDDCRDCRRPNPAVLAASRIPRDAGDQMGPRTTRSVRKPNGAAQERGSDEWSVFLSQPFPIVYLPTADRNRHRFPTIPRFFGSGVSTDKKCLTPKHPRRARTIPGELSLGCERRPRYVCRGFSETERSNARSLAFSAAASNRTHAVFRTSVNPQRTESDTCGKRSPLPVSLRCRAHLYPFTSIRVHSRPFASIRVYSRPFAVLSFAAIRGRVGRGCASSVGCGNRPERGRRPSLGPAGPFPGSASASRPWRPAGRSR